MDQELSEDAKDKSLDRDIETPVEVTLILSVHVIELFEFCHRELAFEFTCNWSRWRCSSSTLGYESSCFRGGGHFPLFFIMCLNVAYFHRGCPLKNKRVSKADLKKIIKIAGKV